MSLYLWIYRQNSQVWILLYTAALSIPYPRFPTSRRNVTIMAILKPLDILAAQCISRCLKGLLIGGLPSFNRWPVLVALKKVVADLMGLKP